MNVSTTRRFGLSSEAKQREEMRKVHTQIIGFRKKKMENQLQRGRVESNKALSILIKQHVDPIIKNLHAILETGVRGYNQKRDHFQKYKDKLEGEIEDFTQWKEKLEKEEKEKKDKQEKKEEKKILTKVTKMQTKI